MAERLIAGTELMGALPEVLEEIAERGTVFLVIGGEVPESVCLLGGPVSGAVEIRFVLGPFQTLGEVFGLIDEEYGWPHPIQVSEVKALSDLVPGRRRHPMIWREAACVALSISRGEYELLKGRPTATPEERNGLDGPFG
jgi:hypothetical protein